jgi:hypothetical protein
VCSKFLETVLLAVETSSFLKPHIGLCCTPAAPMSYAPGQWLLHQLILRRYSQAAARSSPAFPRLLHATAGCSSPDTPLASGSSTRLTVTLVVAMLAAVHGDVMEASPGNSFSLLVPAAPPCLAVASRSGLRSRGILQATCYKRNVDTLEKMENSKTQQLKQDKFGRLSRL